MKPFKFSLLFILLWQQGLAFDLETYEKMEREGYEYIERLGADKEKGTLRPINFTILEVLKGHKYDLQQVADRFPDVKPSTIAACIVAENTMNVQVDDDVANFLATNANPIFELTSTILGKDPKDVSVGLGQINVNAALEGEPLLADLEKREELTAYHEREIRQRLNTTEGAFLYGASIIQNAINKYREAGFDISHDPGLQCTLYNIGQAESRANRSKEKGRQPSSNYFGFFVNHYMDEYFKQFDKEVKEKPVAVAQEKPVDSWRSQRLTIEEPINAFAVPPLCQDTHRERSGGKPVQESNKSLGAVSGRYRVVGFGMGCGLNAYTSIQLQNGKIVWVPSLSLQEKSTSVHIAFPDFQTQPDDCLPADQLKSCLADLPVEVEDPSVPFSGRMPVDTKMIKSLIKKYHVFEPIHYRELDQSLQRIKKETVRAMGYTSWDDPNNIYQEKMKRFDPIAQCADGTLTNCASALSWRQFEDAFYFARRGIGYTKDPKEVDHHLDRMFRSLEDFEVKSQAQGSADAKDSRVTLANANNAIKVSYYDQEYILELIEFAKENFLKSINKDRRREDRIESWDSEKNPNRDIFDQFKKLRICPTCFIEGTNRLSVLIDDIQAFTRRDVYVSGDLFGRIRKYKVKNMEDHYYSDNWFKFLLTSVIRTCHESTSESSGLSELIRAHRNISVQDEATLNKITPEQKEYLAAMASDLMDACSSQSTCQAYIGDDDNIDCLRFSRPYDAHFFCRFAYHQREDSVSDKMKDFACMFYKSELRECRKSDVSSVIPEISRLAQKDCVQQIFSTNDTLVHEILDESDNETLNSKLSFLNPPKRSKVQRNAWGGYERINAYFDYSVQLKPVCPAMGP